MLLERLLDNLALSIEAFATCRVAPGWRLRLPPLDWTTFHYVVAGEGAVRDADGQDRLLPAGSLAIVPPSPRAQPAVRRTALRGTDSRWR